MIPHKKIYFISDFHFGVPDAEASKQRERKFIQWIREVKNDASEIYLLGDLFDFWFEYKTVVPKGYVEIMATIKKVIDEGIAVYMFTGNHDMWMFGYLEEEIGIKTYYGPIEKEISGKRFMIGHGDGLGPGDYGYKFIKKIFASKVCQWLFRWIHPDIGIPFARFWSARSRAATGEEAEFLGEDKEWLIRFSREVLKTRHIDYFIFGHRHLPIEYRLNESSVYINTGDWIRYYSYAVFDGSNVQLKYYNYP